MRWFLRCVSRSAPFPHGAADPVPKPSAAQIEFFETKVRPVLADHCYSCHGPKKQSAGLRLDTAAGLKAGADNGPVFVAGRSREEPARQLGETPGRFPRCRLRHRSRPVPWRFSPSG